VFCQEPIQKDKISLILGKNCQFILYIIEEVLEGSRQGKVSKKESIKTRSQQNRQN